MNLYNFLLTVFMKFVSGIGNMDIWYINLDIAIDLTIRTLPSFDNPSGSIYWDMLLFLVIFLNNLGPVFQSSQLINVYQKIENSHLPNSALLH